MPRRKIKTASGRELSFPEFSMEARAVSSGWPVSDELKADVVETCHMMIENGSDREKTKACGILAALEKQNIEIAKEMRRQHEASGATFIQNNLNVSPDQENALYEILANLMGGTTPDSQTHSPAIQPQLVVEEAVE